MNYSIIFSLVLILNLITTARAQGDGDRLFDSSILHDIKINAENISDLWDSISRDFLMVDMSIDGILIDSVGLKIRGATSASAEQIPLEIDFNKFVSDKHYNGLTKFNMRNNFLDPSLQNENLAYEIYRRAGLPTPRAAYAAVYVNNIFRGIYSIVEAIDKHYLGQHFASKNGSLYKGKSGLRGLTVEVKQGTMTEFDEFRLKGRTHNLSEYVHLDNYLKHLSTDIIVGDWDSYAYDRHNFYIYYEPKSEKLSFLNWDHNFAFTEELDDIELYPLGTYPSLDNYIESPSLLSKYEQTLCELLTYVLDSSFIMNEISHNYHIINSNQSGFSVEYPQALVDYIFKRKGILQDTLSQLGVTCKAISYPLNPNDLVINEFVSASKNAKESNNSHNYSSDWIELYNNTSADILLDKHYYLSDDKYNPKKWSFPETVTIPGNGYFIIWADENFKESGYHTGFKLNKDGGDIIMTYEDMTVIQHISYKEQENNKAFARSPNGTGQFIIQSPTFNSINE